MLSDELDSDTQPDDTSPLMEFELPFVDLSPGILGPDLSSHHAELSKFLGLPEDLSNLNHIFNTIASLCDVYTQPEENDDIVLSIDYIADLVIALAYSNLQSSLNTNPLAPEEVKTPELQSLKFDMALAFFTLLETILSGLKCNSLPLLEGLDNSESMWFVNMDIWTPVSLYKKGPLFYNLCYRMATVLLYVLYKLFIPEDGSPYNLALNPFLFYFVNTWKCQTTVIYYGLEIDRRLEEKGAVGEDGSSSTPDIILECLKGSSAIRYVSAWILNQNSSLNSVDKEIVQQEMQETEHDLKETSLLLFMHPLGRKKIDGGALTVDIRLITAALLTVNSVDMYPAEGSDVTYVGRKDDDSINYRTSNAGKVGKLMFDLEYLDRFDEDIRYIFLLGAEMEDDDENYDDDDDEDDEDGLEYEYVDENGEKLSQREIMEYLRRSKTLENPQLIEQLDGSISNNPSNESTKAANNKGGITNNNDTPSALRSTKDPDAVEFDEHGRDWRDIPRGENVKIRPDVLEDIGERVFTKWEDFTKAFRFVSTTTDSTLFEYVTMADVMLNTVIKSIINEEKGTKQQVTPGLIESHMVSVASPEDIQWAKDNNWIHNSRLEKITNWELLFRNNVVLATTIFDEMLMCKGYRRILIWYLARVVCLSAHSVNYIFELAKGMRGTTKLFSRQGGLLILSEVERLMLIDEFISNALVMLCHNVRHGADDSNPVSLDNPVAIKLAMLVCLAIGSFIGASIIDVHAGKPGHEDLFDFSPNLQVFLISWVGILPAARKLYFLIKKAKDGDVDTDEDLEDPFEGDPFGEEDNEHENEQQVEVAKYMNGLSTVLEQQEIVNDLKEMEPWDSSEYFRLNPEKLLIVNGFTNSFVRDVNWMFCLSQGDETYVKDKMGPAPTNIEFQEDLQMFLNNFNSWSKIEYFAQETFNGLENLAKNGGVVDPDEEEEEEEGEEEEEEEEEEDSDVDDQENEKIELNASPVNARKKSKREKLKKNDIENEFNDEFLDGLGEFRDDGKKPTKKKKKKKKKGKKK